jgi:hypothetical protein
MPDLTMIRSVMDREEDYRSNPLTIEREADLNRFSDDFNNKVVSSEVDEWGKFRNRQLFLTIFSKLHE